MNSLEEILQNNGLAHHAYGVESTSETLAQDIIDLLDRDDYSYIFNKSYDQLKVSDARDLKHLQSEKTHKKSLFILSFTVINKEAQNALLKVLEEPTPNTYFILVFPLAQVLLPTLRSRLQIIPSGFGQVTDADLLASVVEFLEMPLSARFDWIKKRTDKKNKERITKKELLVFCNVLEEKAAEASMRADFFESIFLARKSLSANGASSKMILEMLAISLEN